MLAKIDIFVFPGRRTLVVKQNERNIKGSFELSFANDLKKNKSDEKESENSQKSHGFA